VIQRSADRLHPHRAGDRHRHHRDPRTLGLPKLNAARLTANEASAISTLRSLSTAQVQVLAQASIDTDGDGAGEQGYFGELAGTASCARTSAAWRRSARSASTRSCSRRGSPRQRARSRFALGLFLPDLVAGSTRRRVAPGISERPVLGGATPGNLPDSDAGELMWCAYAWPMLAHQTGNRAFFINQSGEMLQFQNRMPAPFSNTINMPPFDEAFSTAGDMSSALRVGVPAAPAGPSGRRSSDAAQQRRAHAQARRAAPAGALERA